MLRIGDIRMCCDESGTKGLHQPLIGMKVSCRKCLIEENDFSSNFGALNIELYKVENTNTNTQTHESYK